MCREANRAGQLRLFLTPAEVVFHFEVNRAGYQKKFKGLRPMPPTLKRDPRLKLIPKGCSNEAGWEEAGRTLGRTLGNGAGITAAAGTRLEDRHINITSTT